MFGNSSGGVLALEAAAHGLTIRKLAVYEPIFNSGDEEARRESKAYAKQLEAMLQRSP